jgi:hypothetical protein
VGSGLGERVGSRVGIEVGKLQSYSTVEIFPTICGGSISTGHWQPMAFEQVLLLQVGKLQV